MKNSRPVVMHRDIEWTFNESEYSFGTLNVSTFDGHPVFDVPLSRLVGYKRLGENNSCFMDPETQQCLARLIEGPIMCPADLEGAERALQVLFWHDNVDVLLPATEILWAPKPEKSHQMRTFVSGERPRSKLALELFKGLNPVDLRVALTTVGPDPRSENIVSEQYRDIREFELWEGIKIARTHDNMAALSVLPFELNAPAYFSDRKYESRISDIKKGFFGELHSRILAKWFEGVELVPQVDFVVNLPPLVAIVLDRSRSRDSIPETINELREELSPVRKELVGFGDFVRGANNQVEIERRCQDIIRSFDSIVPASRWEKAPVYSLLKLYKVIKSPLDWIMSMTNPNYVPSNPKFLAERTLTGRVFSKYLKTDSMHSLLSSYLSDPEVSNLEYAISNGYWGFEWPLSKQEEVAMGGMFYLYGDGPKAEALEDSSGK